MSEMTSLSGSDSAFKNRAARRGAAPQRPRFRLSDIWKAPFTDLPIRDEIIYQYLPLAQDMEVLEIGPGAGFPAFRLSRVVREIILLDVAARNIERLRENLKGIPNVDFVSADICDPRLTETFHRRFDVIEATEVFEFLPDPQTALNNMGKLLRPGGTLFLQFPNYDPGRSPGITCFRQKSELVSLLRQAGFEAWEMYALRLRPYADFLYRNFHEKPINLYRRMKQKARPTRPLTFDEAWFFGNQSRLERYRPILHLVWMGFMTAMHLGGSCFERSRVSEGIQNHNLLVVARKSRAGRYLDGEFSDGKKQSCIS